MTGGVRLANVIKIDFNRKSCIKIEAIIKPRYVNSEMLLPATEYVESAVVLITKSTMSDPMHFHKLLGGNRIVNYTYDSYGLYPVTVSESYDAGTAATSYTYDYITGDLLKESGFDNSPSSISRLVNLPIADCIVIQIILITFIYLCSCAVWISNVFYNISIQIKTLRYQFSCVQTQIHFVLRRIIIISIYVILCICYRNRSVKSVISIMYCVIFCINAFNQPVKSIVIIIRYCSYVIHCRSPPMWAARK